jgi:O-antigen/teichoic acid export membrane protein
MDVGWPMMAQVLASPLAITLQRYLLAHDGTEQQVAEYGVLGQVFFAVMALVSAAGLALWPAYAKARHEGRLRRGPYLMAGAFGGGVLVATAVVWSVRDWLFSFITHGTIAVSSVDVLLFGVMVAVQAALYPLGMFIMDRAGLRFQVVPVAVMVVSTIGLTLVLTPSLGVSGPLVASAASALVFQVVPFCAYIHRHRDRLFGPGERSNERVGEDPTPSRIG